MTKTAEMEDQVELLTAPETAAPIPISAPAAGPAGKSERMKAVWVRRRAGLEPTPNNRPKAALREIAAVESQAAIEQDHKVDAPVVAAQPMTGPVEPQAVPQAAPAVFTLPSTVDLIRASIAGAQANGYQAVTLSTAALDLLTSPCIDPI
jgi:hypothetical protein